MILTPQTGWSRIPRCAYISTAEVINMWSRSTEVPCPSDGWLCTNRMLGRQRGSGWRYFRTNENVNTYYNHPFLLPKTYLISWPIDKGKVVWKRGYRCIDLARDICRHLSISDDVTYAVFRFLLRASPRVERVVEFFLTAYIVDPFLHSVCSEPLSVEIIIYGWRRWMIFCAIYHIIVEGNNFSFDGFKRLDTFWDSLKVIDEAISREPDRGVIPKGCIQGYK